MSKHSSRLKVMPPPALKGLDSPVLGCLKVGYDTEEASNVQTGPGTKHPGKTPKNPGPPERPVKSRNHSQYETPLSFPLERPT